MSSRSEKKVSRRAAIVSGGVASLLSLGWLRRVHGQQGRGRARRGAAGAPRLPQVRPFDAELPIPAVLQPLGIGSPPYTPGAVLHGIAPEFARLSQWELMPTKYYSMDMVPSTHQFFPGVETPVWTYNGTFPGPTVKSRIGQPAVIRLTNRLSIEGSMHLHGGHSPAHSDGYPTFYVNPGAARDYFYPQTVPLHNGAPDYSETPSTAWYHDHAMDIAGHNVYMGLAGLHLYTDDIELNLVSSNVLPQERYDVPLVISDKRFNRDGTLAYDILDHNGQLGDVYTVNGKIQPHMVVERRKYRFRICNASNARFYVLRLNNRQTFLRIANDSWLLPSAMVGDNVLLAPGNRTELIIDFTNAPSEVYLENILPQDDGRGPDGKNYAGRGEALPKKQLDRPIQLVKFVVRGQSVLNDAKIANGTPLRPHLPIPMNEVEVTRNFRFERSNGAWMINGEFYDPNRADAIPRLGSAERWIISNNSGGWWHPIHIHLESHQVRSINGQIPPPWLRFKSDNTVLGPNDSAEVVMRFRTFTGPFAFHCHNIEHEDMRMMKNVDPRVTRVREPAPIVDVF